MNKKLIKVSNALLLTEFKHIFRVMKLTSLFGVLCVSSAFAINVNSQSLRVNIQANQKQAKEVIKQIEEQTDYLFVYNHDKVNLNNTVTIQANNETVAEVLNQMFAGTDIIYAMQGNNILLMQKDAVVQQSGKVVTGTIVDPSGMPVIGANVMVKGTTNGTITDMDGKFSLEVEEGATLQISYIGYANQEIKVGNKKTLSIALKEDAEALDELVVVGYGTQKKGSLTGAVTQVSGDVLNSKPISNLGQGLQGVIPNLYVSTGSGVPGQGSTYKVRGSTSITDGAGPLILVDGVQMDPNLISPQDVESVTVLKDAASAAIYGARGGYGVILITTKNGKNNDKPSVSFSANVGLYQPSTVPRTPDAMQWANYINQVATNAGQQPVYNDTYMSYVKAYYNDPENNSPVFYDPAANDPKHLNDPTAWSYCGNTDWFGEIIEPFALDQRYNLSLRGGTNNTTYYVSESYNKNDGLMEYYNDKYERWNTNIKVNSKITDWLEVGGNLMYNYSNKDLPTPGIWGGWGTLFLDYLSPFMPIRHPDGHFSGQGADSNPAAVQSEGGYEHTKINDAWLTGNVKITPWKGLSLNADYTFNYYSRDVDTFVREFYEYRRLPGTEALYPWTTPNSTQSIQNNDYYSAFNAYAQYDQTFAEKHNISATVGYNYENKSNRGFGVEREGLISNDVPYLGLASGEIYVRNQGSSEWGIAGLFLRANYDYDNKYYVTFSGRYDGSSKFPKGNRYAFFPSVSGAWRISSEPFMESTKTYLDDLKVRVSYGSLGNQAGVGNFSYFPGMGVNTSYGYLINGALISTVSAPGLVSNSYTWETIQQIDAGFDFTLLQNRLTGTFDWYRRNTLDMLAPSQPYPATLGTSAPKVNSADMKTTGWEVSLEWNDKLACGFNYHVGLTLSDYRGEITKYYNPTGNIDTWYVGKKFGDVWGYTTDRLYLSEEDVSNGPDQSELYGGQWMPGDVKFKDLNNDGKITRGKKTLDDHGDLSVIGNTEPRYCYGITLGGSFKGFDLDMLFQGVGHKDFFAGGTGFWGSSRNYEIPTAWTVENTWTPENTDAYLPRPMMGNTYNQQTQTGYMLNAGYLRLKNLTLGYTLPKAWTEKAFISKARIYFSGQNLFCITSLPEIYDPETLSYSAYPVQRVFSFGLDINF